MGIATASEQTDFQRYTTTNSNADTGKDLNFANITTTVVRTHIYTLKVIYPVEIDKKNKEYM
jgi:hypothetical protein